MSLLFAQISESNQVQTPNEITSKKSVKSLNGPKNNVYQQFSADGSVESNQFWNQSPLKWPTVPQPNDARNGGPIYERKLYQPSIIRPIDSVMVPRSISRGSFAGEKCNWPCYAGSKYQEWCSEEDAINYHAMRPLVEPDTYNKWLQKLFFTVTKGSKVPQFNENIWSAVFCQNTKKDLMNFLMKKVAEAVSLIPEMHKNGSWGYEQFHWTDAKVFQYLESNNQMFYKILFNLYNPLRSVSTEVYTVISVSGANNQDLNVRYMGFVNQLEWKMNGQKIDGISGYNMANAGENPQINVETEVEGPEPTALGWNYGNTLVQQEFNKQGFYENGANVEIRAGVPDSLKQKIQNFSEKSNSYLFGCATSRFSGNDVSKDFENKNSEFSNQRYSGTPQSLMNNPTTVFGIPLDLKQNENGSIRQNVKRFPETNVIGNVYI